VGGIKRDKIGGRTWVRVWIRIAWPRRESRHCRCSAREKENDRDFLFFIFFRWIERQRAFFPFPIFNIIFKIKESPLLGGQGVEGLSVGAVNIDGYGS